MSFAKLTASNPESVTIQLTIPLSKSMLKSEQTIQNALNNAGAIAAAKALESFDTDGSAIQIGSTKLTSKGKINKKYQTPWAEVEIERHVYQSPKGGQQFCPLEKDARIILTSTPGFAKLVSSKYAELGSSRVLVDLKQNHGRTISRPYLKHLCDAVGAVAQAKEESWEYALPTISEKIASVAVGVDGTCMLLVQDGWREAMVGTICLYNKHGKRMHTIQIAATPEYGKKIFYERFSREIDRIKQKYPNAKYIGIADGAKCNWDYLASKTDLQTIDFWHASSYLGHAAEAMFAKQSQEADRKEWLEAACHKLKHKVASATRLLKEMQAYEQSHKLAKKPREMLLSAIRYFSNHKDKMRYACNAQNNFPIGSGVTEAACKPLVKQRLCNSGMRWKEQGAAAVLSLRALAHTDCRWEQFWSKIDSYGYPLAA